MLNGSISCTVELRNPLLFHTISSLLIYAGNESVLHTSMSELVLLSFAFQSMSTFAPACNVLLHKSIDEPFSTLVCIFSP